ncbi:UBX domain-containing protein 10 [Ophidiomyces ophidiicola]|nr:UBX domain-containing protein 10 [Ophidiomyces ophidiicola]
MSDEDTSTAGLSPAQQETLQTYIAVTGQEPSEAIPLLSRSEWNAQIAITKFFDGEGPDPLAEAQALPPQRVTRNLLHELDDLSPQPSSAARGLEPAPRISTQPSEPTTFQPPFLLAILFSPFNLLSRMLVSSLRIFGTLFPFLPRILSAFTSSTLRNTKGNTSGRKSLGPKDTAVRFIREFEEEYGPNTLHWLESGYNMAVEKAHRDLKFLVVIILSPEHDYTNSWVKDTLLSEQVKAFLADPRNNVLLWGGNVQDSEAYQVAHSLRCTKFPFAAVISHTPNVSSSAMSVIARMTGLTSPSAFLEKARSAMDQNKASLDRARSSRAEQQASRSIQPAMTDPDAIRISIRLVSGERVIRRFSGNTSLEDLYAFVECYEVFKAESEEAGSSKIQVERPHGFEHKYGFRLVSPMPRVVYDLETGGSMKQRVGHGSNLLVETIDDESSDNE